MRNQNQDQVIAILCADIHLSMKPPRGRREEPDWFKAMKKSLDDLALLSSHYNAPILCAGDVFDHWKAEPHLINFALEYLPTMYAIPGQHDLPLHNMDLIEKSAFWTLSLAEKIIPVIQEEPIALENSIVLHSFPWGRKLKPLEDPIEGRFHVALVHDFFWIKGHTFQTASKNHRASKYKNKVKGYHAVCFGDNHSGFKIKLDDVPVLNCGTLMRRKSHEKEYRPRIGLLCKSGRILIHRVNIKGEYFRTVESALIMWKL
jgi:DNA repair exonuclease SbcCD nuclease subunit